MLFNEIDRKMSWGYVLCYTVTVFVSTCNGFTTMIVKPDNIKPRIRS
jgi:hypothetical protein